MFASVLQEFIVALIISFIIPLSKAPFKCAFYNFIILLVLGFIINSCGQSSAILYLFYIYTLTCFDQILSSSEGAFYINTTWKPLINIATFPFSFMPRVLIYIYIYC
jgi:hypothetical protein